MKIGATAAYTYAFAGTEMTLEDYLTSIESLPRLGIRCFDLEILQAKHVAIYKNEDNIRRLEEALVCSGVSIVGFTAWACLKLIHSADPGHHEKGFALFGDIAGIAKRLGAEYIHLGSDMIDQYIVERYASYEAAPAVQVRIPENISYSKVLDEYACRLSRLAGIAEEHGLRFSLEPRANSLVATADGFLDLHRRANHSNLYCCLDVIHSAFHREDLCLAIEKLGSKLLVFQACNAVPGEMIHYPLSEGRLDVSAMLKTLRKVRFDGFLMIEIYRSGADTKETADEWYRQAAAAVTKEFK